jgi:hypothetical protein
MADLFRFKIRRPYGRAVVELEVYGDGDTMIAGIKRLKGCIDLPPKRWLKVVRAHVKRLEVIVKESGCRELRVAGRFWGRVLPDYEPYDGVPNGLRKVLI